MLCDELFVFVAVDDAPELDDWVTCPLLRRATLGEAFTESAPALAF